MIPTLIRQNVKFKFFVITQTSTSGMFNRGMLLNAGFDQVSKQNEFDCFIFHDVDLILKNDFGIYHCERMGRESHEFCQIDS